MMKKNTRPIRADIQELSNLSRQTHDSIHEQINFLLQQILSKKLPEQASQIKNLHDDALFLCAYPANEAIRLNAEQVLKKIVKHIIAIRKDKNDLFLYNSGIPGAKICASFSYVLNDWLLNRFKTAVSLDSFESDTVFLQTLLNNQIEPIMQETLTDERSSWDFFKRANIPGDDDPHLLFKWLMQHMKQLPLSPTIRDTLFAQWGVYTTWNTETSMPSLTNSRIKSNPFYQKEAFLKHADPTKSFEEIKPRRINLQINEQRKIVDIARGVLCALLRETDTFTNVNPNEIELWDMGRGVQIALFYMKPEYKMALETYAGYLLFKNGVPCSYGGAWILNKQAGFGVNVLPPFRGGESADLVCRLLTLYRHRFQSESFIVDPYQIGRHNDDGIRSGAFWFYYRLGFRPQQKPLYDLAKSEWEKITENRKYRTSPKILRQLAHATMALGTPSVNINKIADFVSKHVRNRYEGMPENAHKVISAYLEQKGMNKSLIKKAKPLLNLLDAYGMANWNKKDTFKIIEICALKANAEAMFTQKVLENQTFKNIFESEV